MSLSGINSLVTLAQLKQTNANEAALDGADKQRGLIKKMKDLRAQERALDDKLLDKELTTGEVNEIRGLLREGADDLNIDESVLSGLSYGANAEGETVATMGAEGAQADNQDITDRLKSAFQDAIKDLEAQDKLGNFEVQDLMSSFNQAQTMASNVQKKIDDTANSVIGKI